MGRGGFEERTNPVRTNAEKQAVKERNFTAEMLRAVMHYDPSTGVFTWRFTSRGGRKAGAIAGRSSGTGYWQICIDRKYFYAQRLAWLYVTGEWPPFEIDHEDLNKTNNRFSNLRRATDLQNQGNRGANRNNACGIKGVRYLPKTGMWQARITDGGKGRHLGNYSTSEQAARAYATAAQEKFGQFARTV